MRGQAAWQIEVRRSGADALRERAETLEQQPDAIWRGKRQKTAADSGNQKEKA